MSQRDPELTKLLVQELERHLAELLHAETSPLAVESVGRAVHALKGSSGLAGEPELAAAMQRLERRLRERAPGALDDVTGTIRVAIERLSRGETALPVAWPDPPPDLVVTAQDTSVRAQYLAEVTDRLVQIDAALASAGDPAEAVTSVYRHLHTIKGAASAVGDEPMAWFCHGLEERVRAGTATSAGAVVALDEVARYRAIIGALLDDPLAALAALRAEAGRPWLPSRASQRPAPAPEDEAWHTEGEATIRVSAQAVDRLLEHIGGIAVARERVAARAVRAGTQARALRKVRSDLAEALRLIGPPRPWGAPAAALRRVERAVHALLAMSDELEAAAALLSEGDAALKDNTGSAKKLLSAMRQTPLRGTFGRLAAAALAEARRTGRLVTIRTLGGDETIDRRLAEHLIEPCLQLTRNAIAHGIEPPAEREAQGKPREATITFTAKKLGNRLAVTIADDGSGVDVAAVRARAIAAGAVTEVVAEAADDQTLLELLFFPGFSMRGDSPDLLAGRGLGLDITLAAVQKLGGSIRLSNRHRHGFEARVDVPIETGLAAVLWVSAGGVVFALPAAHAERVTVNDGSEVDRVPHLALCLEPGTFDKPRFVVDLAVGVAEPERLRVGVDGVGATEEVFVRELAPLLRGLGPFSGAVLRGDGSLHLALDVHALAPRIRALGRVPDGKISEPPSRPRA